MNAKFKISLCKLFEATGSCNFGNKCSFAHGSHELRKFNDPLPKQALAEKNDRVPYSNYKTIKCSQYYHQRYCQFGIRCSFAHGDFELRSKYDPIYPPLDCYPPVPPHLFFPYYCETYQLLPSNQQFISPTQYQQESQLYYQQQQPQTTCQFIYSIDNIVNQEQPIINEEQEILKEKPISINDLQFSTDEEDIEDYVM